MDSDCLRVIVQEGLECLPVLLYTACDKPELVVMQLFQYLKHLIEGKTQKSDQTWMSSICSPYMYHSPLKAHQNLGVPPEDSTHKCPLKAGLFTPPIEFQTTDPKQITSVPVPWTANSKP